MKAKQVWEIGAWVRVGFLRLCITGRDAEGWLLKDEKGRVYHFAPYQGLVAVV